MRRSGIYSAFKKHIDASGQGQTSDIPARREQTPFPESFRTRNHQRKVNAVWAGCVNFKFLTMPNQKRTLILLRVILAAIFVLAFFALLKIMG
jgi:hypothetical protein